MDDVRDGRASLRDITFQDGTGFPIFRNEPVETVRGILFPEKTTVPQVNLEAELTEAELALMRPQLDAAGIDYLVANAGYNRRTISFPPSITGKYRICWTPCLRNWNSPALPWS